MKQNNFSSKYPIFSKNVLRKKSQNPHVHDKLDKMYVEYDLNMYIIYKPIDLLTLVSVQVGILHKYLLSVDFQVYISDNSKTFVTMAILVVVVVDVNLDHAEIFLTQNFSGTQKTKIKNCDTTTKINKKWSKVYENFFFRIFFFEFIGRNVLKFEKKHRMVFNAHTLSHLSFGIQLSKWSS